MGTVLSDLSAAMADMVELGGASIVRVEGRRGLPASGIVWSADGVIVTASHVVSREEGLLLGLRGGDKVEARLVGRDPPADIAVLSASAAGLKEPAWLRKADKGIPRTSSLVNLLEKNSRQRQTYALAA